MQDAYGVQRRARQHSLMRNRRDPSQRPTSGEGGSYKPMAKWNRAGRESEGFIVPLTPVERPDEGRDPALVMPSQEVSARAWSQDPITPLKKCENSSVGCTSWPSANRSVVLHAVQSTQRSDVLLEAGKPSILEARMPHEKTIGKPDAGNPHVRFDRGPQETEPVRHRA
jgi:hypothetical protein